MRTTTVDIRGYHDDEVQSVIIYYEYISEFNFLNDDAEQYYINSIEIKLPIYIEPDFLEEDIRMAIACDLSSRPLAGFVKPGDVHIQCEIIHCKNKEEETKAKAA